MIIAYVAVTLATVAANAFIGLADLLRFRFVLENSAKVGVPQSWLPWLGWLKAVAVVGLLAGLAGVPYVGEAAAVGLVLFYICAVATHLRVRDYGLAFPMAFLALAVATLLLDLGTDWDALPAS